jgi:hypothetical protein
MQRMISMSFFMETSQSPTAIFDSPGLLPGASVLRGMATRGRAVASDPVLA